MTPALRSEVELLPCPFCGGDAADNQADNAPTWWVIECPHPDCEVQPRIESEGRDAAFAAWNRRTHPPEDRSEVPNARRWIGVSRRISLMEEVVLRAEAEHQLRHKPSDLDWCKTCQALAALGVLQNEIDAARAADGEGAK